MAKLVVDGSMLSCSFGMTPSKLKATPCTLKVDGKAAATVMDCMPNVHIAAFGTCSCPSNPIVIAAQGVPQPCMPPGFTPWISASKFVNVNGHAALTTNSKTTCIYGGQITIKSASSMSVE